MIHSLYITIPAALIPSAILLVYIYRKDLHREPIGVVIWTFVLGVLLTVPVSIYGYQLRDAVHAVQGPYLNGFVTALFMAAVPEEFFKLLLLVFFCMRRSAFDEEMDGLVYGAVASLGFATIENVLYVSHSGFGTAVVRAITAVPVHASLGIIMGYYLVKWKEARKSGFLWTALLLPVALHAAYDFPLIALHNLERISAGIRYDLFLLMFSLFFGCILVAYCYAIKIVNLFSRRQQNASLIAEAFKEIRDQLHADQDIPPDRHS